jgi:transposase
MIYVGVDLHSQQMTVSVRNEGGDVVLRRQVSTRPAKVEEFLAQLHRIEGQYVVILEVCGFHDWLVKRLRQDPHCKDVVLIQPEESSKRKTDRRDANRLRELLWINRKRLLAGERVNGLRRVYEPTDDERQDRQITSVRQRLGRQRTRTINQIRVILRRNNLEWERPTKGFQTKKVKGWLKTLPLDETDRLEMDQLLQQWEMWDRQIEQAEERIEERFQKNPMAKTLATIVGVSCYMALAIASRIGKIDRFIHARSLANFIGIVPGSRSSGKKERIGSITKQGSQIVRFLLGQLVTHVLRKDARLRAWYRGIKKRRGAKIARVAVMRRLTGIMWRMLAKHEAYHYEGVTEPRRPSVTSPHEACRIPDRETILAAYPSPAAAAAQRAKSTGSKEVGDLSSKQT